MPCSTNDTSTLAAYEHGGYIVLSLPRPTCAACLRQAFAQKTCVNSVGLVSCSSTKEMRFILPSTLGDW